MTVFCPNCGKPNTDSANQCVACGTELKPKSAGSKFKGTMMMSGVTIPQPGDAQGAPPGGPAPGGPVPGSPAPATGAPAAGAPAGPPGATPDKLAFQQTMAMPSGSFGAPGGAPPAQGGFGAPAGQPPAGATAPQGGFGAPPAGDAPPAQGGFGAPAGQPAAGAAPAQGGFGAPPASQPGGFGAPPASQPGGFGAAPEGQQAGGFAPAGGQPPAGAPPGASGGAPMNPVPAKKKSSPLKYIAMGCGALILFSCLGTGAWAAYVAYVVGDAVGEAGEAFEEAAQQAQENAEAARANTGGGEAAAADGDVCTRAMTCCEAYVAEMSEMTPGLTVDMACAGVRQVSGTPGADAVCTASISTWRTGLENLSRDVPASCQ